MIINIELVASCWFYFFTRQTVMLHKLRNIDRLYLNLTTALNSAVTDGPSERKASEGKQETTEKNVDCRDTTCVNNQSKSKLLFS